MPSVPAPVLHTGLAASGASLRHITTELLRRTASLRVKLKSAKKVLTALEMRDDFRMPMNAGPASDDSSAMIATTVSNSISVTPRNPFLAMRAL